MSAQKCVVFSVFITRSSVDGAVLTKSICCRFSFVVLKTQEWVLKSIDALTSSFSWWQRWSVLVLINFPLWKMSVFSNQRRQWSWEGEKKILHKCDITREHGLMVNKYKNKEFCVPLEAPWLCTIWAAQHSAEKLSYLCIRCVFNTVFTRTRQFMDGKPVKNDLSYSDCMSTENIKRIKLMQVRWKSDLLMDDKHVAMWIKSPN